LHTVYLLGDIKYSPTGRENLKLLKSYINKENENSNVVILGDIMYELGLPNPSDNDFKEAERNLKYVLHTFDSYKGDVFFLPGNHDWARGKQQGWESVKNEEEYIEEYLNEGNVYLPDNGCPGPVEVELSNDITLIIFDSQWWFHKYNKPGSDGECGFENENELFTQIEDALKRNRDKKVIFATHHPLFSVGKHGGHFPAPYFLFPLLDIKDWMYIPLPGFIYTGYRKYMGSTQDFAHPEYKLFKETLLNIFSEYPNVIYAAGHEHNLQYFQKDSLHHIISGAGGDASYIARKKEKTDFAYQNAGFNKLSFYANGDVWMEFISLDSTTSGEIIFRKKLFNKIVFDSVKQDAIIQNLDFTDSVVYVKVSDLYSKGKMTRLRMGENYRNVWNATVELPVFDIGSEKGGLNIIKRGGGQQTKSIRMEDSSGKQYVLRSVNKYVEKALAENLRHTVAKDILQDGISASHPFAAIPVPILADAAGVMHTNPKIVWVPDDPRFGIYREEMAKGVFLFEERPAGNREDVASFGRSEKIVNTAKVIYKTQKNHDHIIDQNEVVRARLFDMLINDWDRHDDQWRWASFKDDKTTTYIPIPRARDQVFFLGEGVLMGFTTHFWPMRKFQGFDYTIKDVKGLMFNGRYFDRSFMSEPNLEDWLLITQDIQQNLNDLVMYEAILKFPENVYDSSGMEIKNKLKSRRDFLHEYAEDYYRFLSKDVDVVGTEERELFVVKRAENGDTQVKVFALSDKKGKVREQLYSRDFKYDETKEIRLYGLAGKDKFTLNGNGSKGIKIRIIGGKGNDIIIDKSKVRGLTKKTIVYDRKYKDNEITKSKETRLKLSHKKEVNKYDRKQFQHNKILPILWTGYNIDDGVFLGGGVYIKRYNFRDSTFHSIKGNLSFQTGAFALKYEGLYTSVSQIFDLTLNAELSIPHNVNNYFGLGNNTEKLTDDKTYYRVRYEYAWLNPAFKQTLSKHLYYSLGAFYQYFKVTDTTGRFIGDIHPQLLDSSAYLQHNYVGINAMYELDTRNNKILTNRGILWKTEALGFYSINDIGEDFIKLRSDLRFYLSFRKDPRVVFAFRFGGAVNFGDYEFFHANYLGERTNLRGYRNNRFAGDHSFYQNTEIRIKLLNVRSYVFNGQTGILIFNDIGRVWVNGEYSGRWHDGYGIGVWFSPFEFTAMTVTYNRSKEDSFVDFTFRFMF
ncbi:MAG: BamA/TamA family outer membrane protein, partial [Bacteroidales bacterium]|nr:BamA/TamA family outer membrane protein [Bacteroidales bacterium]